MNKTLSWSSQTQDVRIFMNSNTNIQSTAKKPKNKNKTKELLQSQDVPRSQSAFPAVSVTSVWNPASPKAVYKSSVNNCCYAPYKRYFSSQAPQKSNINAIIYLAIYPNSAFTEVQKHLTSTKWNQLKTMNFYELESNSPCILKVTVKD